MSNEIQDNIRATEQRIDELKKAIEIRDAVMRLQDNADFRKVINENFMVKDCARFAQLSQDPVLDAPSQQDALRIAQAAGHLKRYLSIQIQMGNVADRDLIDNQNVIDELRAEADAEEVG